MFVSKRNTFEALFIHVRTEELDTRHVRCALLSMFHVTLLYYYELETGLMKSGLWPH